jgi:hypothetical protein
MGLYGNVLVDPADPGYWPPVHRELVLTLDDILLEDGKVAPFSRSETTYAAMGRFGDVLLISGEPDLLGQRMQRRETLIGSSPRAARRRHGVELRGRTDDVSGSEVRFADRGRLSPGAVIWATGFALDHSFVQLPVFDTDGRLVHQRGVTASPGLYFLGMPWQHTRGSALPGWVKDDAQHVADQIAPLTSSGSTPAAPALAADPPQR